MQIKSQDFKRAASRKLADPKLQLLVAGRGKAAGGANVRFLGEVAAIAQRDDHFRRAAHHVLVREHGAVDADGGIGSCVVDDEVIRVDFSKRPFVIASHSEICEAHSVIICTGATPRKLGIRAEEQFAGRGVSYCATCDGPFFKGEDIVVVGGGDTALEEATFLTKFGRSVRIVHRKDSLRASKILQEKAFENPKIEFLWNRVVSNIEGDNKIGAVIVKDVNNSNEQKLSAGGLFVAIGHEPNTAIFKEQIALDDKGYIILKNHTATNVDGVFAAGDVHDYRYRQAITAGGFGCMAALDVEKWITERKHS